LFNKLTPHLHLLCFQVDVQSGVSALGAGVGGGPHLAKIYVNAMENSVAQNFRGENGAVNCINCMCHSTENLYRYKITSVARASDDFYPRRPESHTAHLINVAYNSLFLGEICQPDWDMFHSLHESAGLHAAARAVGGCPVYVSDAPGHHDPELLRKLVLPDGSILRAKLPGRPTRDCLFVDVAADEKSALKIWNQNPSGGVICAVNVQGVAWNFDTHENEVLNPNPPAVTAEVKPFDVETLRGEEGPFVALRHRTSTLEFLPKGDTIMRTKLNPRDWEIFTIVPVQIRDNVLWAPLGLADMLNSGGAIQESTDGGLVREGSSIRTSLITRGPGRFVGFTNRRPVKVLVNDVDIAFTHDADDGELSLLLPPEPLPGSSHHVTVVWDNN
jgi:raffinose synthase